MGAGGLRAEARLDLGAPEQEQEAVRGAARTGSTGGSADRRRQARSVRLHVRGRADPGAEWLRLEAVALGRQEGRARGIPLPRPQAHVGLVARTERHPRIHPSAARRVVERKDGAPVRASGRVAPVGMGAQFRTQAQAGISQVVDFWCRWRDSNPRPTHYESDTRLDAKRNPLELLRLSAAQSASLCPAWAQSGAQPYVSREV